MVLSLEREVSTARAVVLAVAGVGTDHPFRTVMSSIDFSINPLKIEDQSHPVSEQVPTRLSADEVAPTLLAAPKVIGIVAEPVA